MSSGTDSLTEGLGATPPPYAYIGNHVERAINTLPAVTSDPTESPNLHAMIAADANQVQVLENVTPTLEAFLTMEGAQGIWQDDIGELVGQPRGADNDADYRIKLRAAALRNRSNGTHADIVAVLTALLGNMCTQVRVIRTGIRELTINLVCPAPLSAATKQAVIDFALESIAAGIHLAGIAYLPTNVFAFEGFPEPPGAGYDLGVWADYFYLN